MQNDAGNLGESQGAKESALWAEAERHFDAGRLQPARAALESLVAQRPQHALARLRLSTLATAQGRYRDSLEHLLVLAAARPGDPDLLLMLAGILHRLGEARAALDCLEHPVWSTTGERALLEQAAQLASQLEDLPLCERLLSRLGTLGPLRAGAQFTRASSQVFMGRLAEAEHSLESLLGQYPGHPRAHWLLSRLRRQTPESNHAPRLSRLLQAGPDPASATLLGFALFKELDDLGHTDAAWNVLQRACALKRQSLDYRPEEDAAAFAELLRQPASPRQAASRQAPMPGPRPVFIVGMPRTGTTLLETLLGKHPHVTNAGELDDFPLQLRWCADRFSRSYLDAGVLQRAAQVDPDLLGGRYLEHAGWRAQGKPVFTDKLPLNFLHVGLIARALPQARILHLTRNPMDTCFSNLKELFTDVYAYSYQLDELAVYYGRYRRLMDHWHASVPGRILDVPYEGLVTDPAATARKVFEFCGFDWRAEYSEESTGAVVTTASSVQVREPIHRRGIEAWRRYEVQLEPLRERLHADGWLPA